MEIKPTFTVKYQDELLTENADYTVSWKNNVNIGTATAVITGIGKFFGTQEISYVIEAHRWNGAMKTVKEPTALVSGRAERKCTVCGKTESKQLAN